MDIKAEKSALRREVLAARAALSAADRARKSAEISQQAADQVAAFFAAQGDRFSSRRPVVALFSSFGTEVDLSDFIRRAQQLGWDMVLPVMLKDAADAHAYMEFALVSPEVALAKSQDFLSKPACAALRASFAQDQFPLVDAWDIDAMLIPLVAFDMRGGRLGYGGGNYDRYLPRLRPDCWRAGIAFAEQCVTQVPRADFDLSIPRVISA